MGCLGNALWFLFGGLIMGLSWALAGVLWCITIVGIPIGTQCFKFASLAFFPFGKEVVYGGGVGFAAAQHFVDDLQRHSSRRGSGSHRLPFLHHHHWHSLWNAVL